MATFFVHHDAIETFLRGLGQQLFGNRTVLLGSEAQAINQTLHLEFGLLDPPEALHLLLAREQGHFAHLVHIHPNGVVQGIELAVFLQLRLLGFGLLGLGVGYNLDAKVTELDIERVQVIRRHAIRQKLIDIVVGKIILLASHLEQSFDGFRELRHLERSASNGVAPVAGGNGLASISAGGFNPIMAGFLRLRFLAAGSLGSKDERVAGPLRLARGRSFSAAAVILYSVIQVAFLHWQDSAIDRRYPMDFGRSHRVALRTKPFAGLVQTNDF